MGKKRKRAFEVWWLVTAHGPTIDPVRVFEATERVVLTEDHLSDGLILRDKFGYHRTWAEAKQELVQQQELHVAQLQAELEIRLKQLERAQALQEPSKEQVECWAKGN